MDVRIIPEANARMVGMADDLDEKIKMTKAQIEAIESQIGDLVDVKAKLNGAIRAYEIAGKALRCCADPSYAPVYEAMPSAVTRKKLPPSDPQTPEEGSGGADSATLAGPSDLGADALDDDVAKHLSAVLAERQAAA